MARQRSFLGSNSLLEQPSGRKYIQPSRPQMHMIMIWSLWIDGRTFEQDERVPFFLAPSQLRCSRENDPRLPFPKQVKTRTCPACGPKRGQTCFVMSSTAFIELKETLLGRAAVTGTPLPRASSTRSRAPKAGEKAATEKALPESEAVPRNRRPKAEADAKVGHPTTG